jgi:hypothetical protein
LHPQQAAVQVFMFRAERFLGTQLFEIREPVTIGRNRRAELRLRGDTISRHHCRLVYERGRILVEDLGSANGTYLNRVRVEGRLEVQPTDAINIGAYTLRVRALHATTPHSISEITDQEPSTRVEAILGIDDLDERSEAGVDLASSVDPKLYEDAIRRATGGERANRVVPLRSLKSFTERSTTNPMSEDVQVPMRMAMKAPSESVRIDPDVEARLRDLDELIAALDAKEKQRAPEKSKRALRAVGQKSPPDPRIVESIDTSAVGARLDPAMIDSLRKMNTKEFARDLASRLAVDGRLLNGKSAKREVPPPLPHVETIPETRVPVPEDTATAKDDVQPESDDGSVFDDVWTRASRVAPLRKLPPPLPNDSMDSSRARLPTVPERSPLPKLIPAPSVPPPLPIEAARPKSEIDTLQTERQTGLPPSFESVEVAARSQGKLLGISHIRQEGEQYILGHRVPDGTMAPASAHPGLRLIRINPDRTVDLVFPKDVAGHLVRGKDTVMFSELTEGRKYSCLRLETHDIATLILGEGQYAISYHVRFIRKAARA